ncbi:MAG: M90 family metallopeptidase [Planctomycetota bacterium]
MIFGWLRRRRRRKLRAVPFPPAWLAILEQRVAHWHYLDDAERAELQFLIQVFVAEKEWEGCGGLEITDDIRVTVAGLACLLLLRLEEHDYYRNVRSILVYPSTIAAPSNGAGPGFRSDGRVPVLGQAMLRGPVILVWDAVLRGAAHPERGQNVAYHEFAHKLDMLDGVIDGTPQLGDRVHLRRWIEVCTRVYEDLVDRTEKRKGAFLDKYGATNVAEFFAVATEYFFNKPMQLQKKRPQLYELFDDFYHQDPASREKRFRQRQRSAQDE